jgi:hypothetical protein
LQQIEVYPEEKGRMMLALQSLPATVAQPHHRRGTP